jgi:shikimate dehydrogenase
VKFQAFDPYGFPLKIGPSTRYPLLATRYLSKMAFDDSVCTLSDLENWSFHGTALAVLGHPIKHSVSPLMHNAALAEMANRDSRFVSWKYFRFEIRPDDLASALKLFHAKKFLGLNLTVPHKILAFGQVAQIDPAAQPIQAVNTLRWEAAGWRGFNTDGYGLASGVQEELGLTLSGAPVILLGAGGAARGAAVECLQRGCASLWVANRTRANLEAFITSLRPLAGPIPLHAFDPGAPITNLPAKALVINATSSGLRESDGAPLDLSTVPSPSGVYDMIYNPPLTPLLRQARQLGLPHANGLSMLAHQGARALEIWSHAAVPVATMSRAIREALAK